MKERDRALDVEKCQEIIDEPWKDLHQNWEKYKKAEDYPVITEEGIKDALLTNGGCLQVSFPTIERGLRAYYPLLLIYIYRNYSFTRKIGQVLDGNFHFPGTGGVFNCNFCRMATLSRGDFCEECNPPEVAYVR